MNIQINKLKRRKEGKTDYRKRLKTLVVDKPRVIIRKSLNNILIQLIGYDPKGDIVICSAHSSELDSLNWKFNKGNIPSSYLTGFLFGNKLIKKKVDKEGIILDIGLNPSIKGSRIYAALKGIIDSGVNMNHSKEIFPSDDRIKGKHISNEIEEEINTLKKKIGEIK